jgi:hypothetical protein
MTDSGWIAVFAFGIAFVTEGGAPVALGITPSEAIALKIRCKFM